MKREVLTDEREDQKDFNKCISSQPEWPEAYYNKSTAGLIDAKKLQKDCISFLFCENNSFG
jgi:hypothetical protein